MKEEYNKLNEMKLVMEQTVVNLKKAKVAEQSEIQRLLKQKEELEESVALLITTEQEKIQDVKEFEKLISRLEQKHAAVVADYEVLYDSETALKASIDGLEDKEKELEESISKAEAALKEIDKQLTNKRGKLKTLVEKVSEVLKTTLIAAMILVPLSVGLYLLIPANYQEVISQLID